ncbi:hypothetical protein PYCC9005_005571 [Savitreella phatthalungensis]
MNGAGEQPSRVSISPECELEGYSYYDTPTGPAFVRNEAAAALPMLAGGDIRRRQNNPSPKFHPYSGIARPHRQSVPLSVQQAQTHAQPWPIVNTAAQAAIAAVGEMLAPEALGIDNYSMNFPYENTQTTDMAEQKLDWSTMIAGSGMIGSSNASAQTLDMARFDLFEYAPFEDVEAVYGPSNSMASRTDSPLAPESMASALVEETAFADSWPTATSSPSLEINERGSIRIDRLPSRRPAVQYDIPEDVSEMTVAQLKTELRQRGLQATGKKETLQARLLDALSP